MMLQSALIMSHEILGEGTKTKCLDRMRTCWHLPEYLRHRREATLKGISFNGSICTSSLLQVSFSNQTFFVVFQNGIASTYVLRLPSTFQKRCRTPLCSKTQQCMSHESSERLKQTRCSLRSWNRAATSLKALMAYLNTTEYSTGSSCSSAGGI